MGPPLTLDPLRHGSFSPDGQWLVTVDLSKIRTWDLTPEDRPVEELEKLARLLAFRALDAKGVIAPIDPEDAIKLFQEVKGK